VVCFLNSTAANGNRTANGLMVASKLTLILRSNTADCHYIETYRGFHPFLHGGRGQFLQHAANEEENEQRKAEMDQTQT
jgi:hypothetical protein